MQSLWQTYETQTAPLAQALADTSKFGVLIDLEARAQLVTEVKQRADETKQRIEQTVGRPVNCNSPKQVATLLYDELRLPVIYKRGSGEKTTDEEALLALHKRYPDEPILNLILSYRKDTKLLSTFLEVGVDGDGRMRTSFNPSGTNTFRISSSQNKFTQSGRNLQNIHKGKRQGITSVRHLFVADPGMVLVKGDLKQAEAMVVAWILTRFGDLTLFDRYYADAHGGPKFDVHKWSGAPIFGKPEAEIVGFMREVGKISNHSGNYCAGPHVIQATALKWGVEGVTYDLAKCIIDTRRSQLPGLERWWAWVERKLQTDRTLTTCLGYRRQFFDRVESAVPGAVAFEPQSTVGCVCNQIFTRLWLDGWRVLLQVHDEVVLECPPERVDEAKAAMKAASHVPLLLNPQLPALVIPIDIASGPNWRDCV